ncbi:hypothetical protein PYW07_013745 [Mythimna separata]|uniref:Uncharacterized protein n=1 Tax=Mythimna separata TaxID=271217 RepID=A0AAD8DPP5_MYTSE|nr:hypothetical protein PYW07_013745 [Mythimna separata]
MADQNSNQNSEDQLTYTMTQEENDLRTYTEDSKTSKNSEQRASDLSTVPTVLDPQLVSVCACLLNSDSDLFKDTFDSSDKQIIDSSVRVETYLCERRIPELIRFILTKIICNKPKSMTKYIADLMDDCMLFRAGHGKAPVLFEERHLKAVIHSFDPCNRGWLTAGQPVSHRFQSDGFGDELEQGCLPTE